MADLNLTAKLLAGEDVDEAALKAEIEAASMQGESFFSPAHEQAEGMLLLDAIETQVAGDDQQRQEVASRARALLGRAEELAQNAEDSPQLVALLKYRLAQDGLPEASPEELARVAKLVRVIHDVDVDVHQDAWEPPRVALEVDPTSLHTASGPPIAPKVPSPHKQRELARKLRSKEEGREGDRDRNRRGDRSRRGTAESANRSTRHDTAQTRQDTGAGSGSQQSNGGTGAHGRDQHDRTSTSTSTGSGGGGGPNSAHAEVHFHFPPGMTLPTTPAPAPAAPSAPVLDAAAVRQLIEDAHRRTSDELKHGLEAVQQSVEAAQQAQQHTSIKEWFLNTGFGQALIAILLLSGLLGIMWWATKPTDHSASFPPTTLQYSGQPPAPNTPPSNVSP